MILSKHKVDEYCKKKEIRNCNTISDFYN